LLITLLSITIFMCRWLFLKREKGLVMRKSILFSCVTVFLSVSPAFAGKYTDNLQQDRSSSPPAKQKLIPERMPEWGANPNRNFTAALDEAVRADGAQLLFDPSRRFQINITSDPLGKIVRVSGDGTSREWRLASGAGNRVTDATITEVLDTVGVETKSGMRGAGALTAQVRK
jgi:hypothetical protein